MTTILNKNFQFKSIRSRLIFWFAIISLLPLIIATITMYKQFVQYSKLSAYNKLEAIRSLKVREVNNWLNERIGNILFISVDDEIRMIENVIEGSGTDDQRSAIIMHIKEHINRFAESYNAFYEIFIISLKTRKILISTDQKDEGKDRSADPYFIGALQNKGLYIKDIYYSQTENRPSMAFSIPIFSLKDTDRVTSVLVARVSLETALYDLLLNRTGMGKTGETLIINKDLIALNKLRWHNDAPLKLKINAKPALEAASGKTGIIETLDYKGKKVLAAYTHISRTQWGFVAKQELSEIYAPVYRLRKWILGIGIMTMLGFVLLARRISKSISGPIEDLHKGSEVIGGGNLDYKIGNDRGDEIGRLSRTFDQMTVNLKKLTASRDELNEEISERMRLENEILEIEDRERQRIGHELHDDLGQQLASIAYLSQRLEAELKNQSLPLVEDAGRLSNLITKSNVYLKLISKGVWPRMENGGNRIITALKELAQNIEEVYNVPCTVTCDSPVYINSKEVDIHLYRIAQETINNAVKHAKPSNIEILLAKENDMVKMIIKNDGRGINDVSEQKKGMGLKSMRYRANKIGASLDIQSDIDKGTTVTCSFNDMRGEIND